MSLTCSCSSCRFTSRRPSRRSARFYPSSSLTDPEWTPLEPLSPLPGNHAGRGERPEKWPRPLVLDAVFYLVRGGIAWVRPDLDTGFSGSSWGRVRRIVRRARRGGLDE
ncbi:transposase [Nocardia sp. NPDC049220]|uniref:transposase n=1 Tax=Nocardia sp. NPDC049220 TaxID=3155273 RepID=UPI0033D6DFB2